MLIMGKGTDDSKVPLSKILNPQMLKVPVRGSFLCVFLCLSKASGVVRKVCKS